MKRNLKLQRKQIKELCFFTSLSKTGELVLSIIPLVFSQAYPLPIFHCTNI